jgi:hypothetical protein
MVMPSLPAELLFEKRRAAVLHACAGVSSKGARDRERGIRGELADLALLQIARSSAHMKPARKKFWRSRL